MLKLLSPSLFLLVFHFSASLHEHWLDYLFTHVISCLAFAIHNCTCFCFIVTLPDAANLSLIGIVLGIRTINRYQDFITFFVTGMQHLDRPGVSFCTRTTYDDNAITNAIEIYDCPSGAVHFTAANNDSGVRDFDMEKFQLSKHFCFPWPVNPER